MARNRSYIVGLMFWLWRNRFVGVVLLLQLRQPRVVGAVGRPDLVGPIFFLSPHVVDIDPSGGIGPQRLPQLPSPVHMSLRLRRVQPLGDEDQIIEGVAVGVGGAPPLHSAPGLLEER